MNIYAKYAKPRETDMDNLFFEYESEFPNQQVPRHMMLLTFKSDDVRTTFNAWLNEHGRRMFGEYLAARNKIAADLAALEAKQQ